MQVVARGIQIVSLIQSSIQDLPMNPQELKTIMSAGLLSFPLTDFDSNGDFNKGGYERRLEWLAPYGASALFAAGGTGEFFSLTGDEYPGIIKTAVDTCRGMVPIIAGAGGPTRFAMQCAQAAEKAGAHGILLLPHYLTEAGQEGLAAHVEAVCKSVGFGVIVYNRASSRLKPDTLARLAERNHNLVGFKDGVGDIEAMVAIYQRMGDRLAYLGGLPTAEVYAAAYKAMGTPVYSSAVFNFIPKTALDFYRAVAADDLKTQHRLLKEFFMPYLELRNRVPGYAVSIVKAGARIVGRDAGPVRPPLSDLTEVEVEQLARLISKLGPQ
jgi:5-dehydro-4-deoxyglucarate dehydratase